MSTPAKEYSLVLDIGTTGVKAFVFDSEERVVAKTYQRLSKSFPKRGWVEQNPQELLEASRSVIKTAVSESGVSASHFSGFGLTNQRETTILWNKETGRPVYPAIVWEDVRTASWCRKQTPEIKTEIESKTGLPVDPYFSASKIRWVLDHVPEAARLEKEGQLLFGTVDTWLLWNLCADHPHVTDQTNASRTLLFNLKTVRWDRKLLAIFGVSDSLLPRVLPSHSAFGILDSSLLGFSIPVLAVCGDQQSSFFSAIRQVVPTGASPVGITKATFGTGTFIMQVSGKTFRSEPGWFTTIVPNGRTPMYARESKINHSGRDVDALLPYPKKLRAFLKRLAKKVAVRVNALPVHPKQLVIDGGVTRAEALRAFLETDTGIPVVPQTIYDGTALGIARLLREPY